jgi:platelet-activating factor acetylhydrolase IB subunit alpha
MLTPSQKSQLHREILEYLSASNFPLSADAFAGEAQLLLSEVDPEGTRMVMKWKSIYSLQKKIMGLEEKVQGLEEELARCSNGKGAQAVKLEELYLPKSPRVMTGHKKPVTGLAFHPHFTELASCSEDGTIKIWDTEGGEAERTLKGHTST